MTTQAAFRNKDIRGIRVLHNGAPRPPMAARTDGTLYEFDEGIRITQEEGTHGVIIIGGLGRGKTASFVMPMAQAMIEDGLGGLVIDVKNNMTPQIMALAESAGRANDIVELGTHPSAIPINPLSGISFDEIEQVISSLCLTGQKDDRNISWMYKSVRLASDIAFVLFQLAKTDPRFTPSFSLLDRCVNDHGFTRRMYQHYLETAHDKRDQTQQAFVIRMDSEPFHILTREKLSKSTHWEQLGYRLSYCRNAFAQITTDDSLLANFSAPSNALQMDYRQLIRKGKIVVLRFKATQGRAATLLAKTLKEKFYRDVYRMLDDSGQPGRPFFFLADEFQDVISIDRENAFDDFSWFSKAREFGCVNIVATQAMSSLYGNAPSSMVDALISNCSTKIFLQNDDPAADQFVRHFVGVERALSQLKNSEALVSRFDLSLREQHVAHLHCSRAFERTRARLGGVRVSPRPAPKDPSPVNRMREVDETLFPYTLDDDLRKQPHYAALVTQFQDILAKEGLTLNYPKEIQALVVKVLCEYRRRFADQKDFDEAQRVAGVAWVEKRWLYLDLPGSTPPDNERFQREILELGRIK